MDLSPERIRDTGFKTVRKGYDPAEVDAFIEKVAAAMETRPEPGHGDGGAGPRRGGQAAGGVAGGRERARRAAEVRRHVDEAETISRTLLLAQRTADTTVAEAQAEARP